MKTLKAVAVVLLGLALAAPVWGTESSCGAPGCVWVEATGRGDPPEPEPPSPTPEPEPPSPPSPPEPEPPEPEIPLGEVLLQILLGLLTVL